jgi:hypothetical protein
MASQETTLPAAASLPTSATAPAEASMSILPAVSNSPVASYADGLSGGALVRANPTGMRTDVWQKIWKHAEGFYAPFVDDLRRE